MPTPRLPASPHHLHGTGLVVDLQAEKAFADGAALVLTGQEWRVLAALAGRAGQVVAKSQIASVLGLPVGSSNNVEFHVSRLRRKLERGSIETIRGRGYRLACPLTLQTLNEKGERR